MTVMTNYVPKNGELVFTISIDGRDVEVVILDSFSNGYVCIEALVGKPFMRGSIWGSYPDIQAVVPRTLLKYAYTAVYYDN